MRYITKPISILLLLFFSELRIISSKKTSKRKQDGTTRNIKQIKARIVNSQPMVLNVPNATWGTPDNYWTNNGYEIKLMSLVAQILKVKIQFYYSDEPQNFGGIYMNGTATGDLKKLQENIDDVAFGGYAQSSERSVHFYTIIDHYDNFHWCVPHILTSNWLERLIKIEYRGTTVVVFVLSAVMPLMLWCFSGKEPANSRYRSLVNCWQICFLLHFCLPIPKYPRSRNLRMLVMFYSSFSFFINMAFQTIVISMLSSGPQEKIRDVNDLVANRYTLYQQEFINFDFMKNYGETDAIREYLRKNERICVDVQMCLTQVVKEQNAAIVLTTTDEQFIVKDFLDYRREPLFYCFREAIIMIPQIVLVRRNFVLKEKMNLIIKRIIEAGIDVKWKRDILFLSKIRHGNKSEIDEEEQQRRVNNSGNETFRVIFLAWVGGCCMGILVFVSEVIFGKLKRSK